MSNDKGRDSRSYQERLRKLGAWLDAASARSVVVMEENQGFAVRYNRQDIESVFLQRFFTYDDLEAIRDGDLRVRRTWVRRVGRKLHGVAAEPGGYQDLFRALGFSLDSASASGVQLAEEESSENLYVFCRPEGTQERMDEQSAGVYGPQEREALRQSAKARRHRRRFMSLTLR